MALFLPRRWNRQPTARVGVDWRNPLTTGLFCAATPTQGPNEIVHGYLPSVIGTGLRPQPTGQGVGWQTISEQRAGIDFGAHNSYEISGTSDFSAFSLSNPSNTGIYRPLIEFRNNASTQVLTMLGADIDFGNGANNGLLEVYKSGNGSDYLARTSNGTCVGILQANAVSCPYNTSSPSFYVNGLPKPVAEFRGTASCAPTLGGTNFAIGALAGSLAFTASSVCANVLALAWNRALSADEHIELAFNPWQVFAPVRRIVYSIPLSTNARPTVCVIT